MPAEPDLLSLLQRLSGQPGSAFSDAARGAANDAASGPSSDHELNPGTPLPEGRVLRPAAVLIGVCADPRGARLMLTKRASGLRHHPGQIALPGGKIDAGDASPEAAALREAREEIGLDPGLVTLAGRLSPHETVTGYSVTPVLALIGPGFTPRPEAGEVDEIFSVPLGHLLDLQNYRIGHRHWLGSERFYHTIPYGPWYIWGATARILRGLAARAAA